MRQLVCWTLMGLRENGGFSVWYSLDSFPTAEEANQAAADPQIAAQGFVETQVMPYYRDQTGGATSTDAPMIERPSAANEFPLQVGKTPTTAV
jgi:hypothetical protein